jgi:hypothetical protein
VVHGLTTAASLWIVRCLLFSLRNGHNGIGPSSHAYVLFSILVLRSRPRLAWRVLVKCTLWHPVSRPSALETNRLTFHSTLFWYPVTVATILILLRFGPRQQVEVLDEAEEEEGKEASERDELLDTERDYQSTRSLRSEKSPRKNSIRLRASLGGIV